jgi:hypothetical protein
MVLDSNRFSPSTDTAEARFDAGLLTILEEIPGIIHFEDMTAKFTNDFYWASFNQPYFKDIYEISGSKDLCMETEEEKSNSSKHGWRGTVECSRNFNYLTDPRGRIFAQRQSNVKDLQVGPFVLPCGLLVCFLYCLSGPGLCLVFGYCLGLYLPLPFGPVLVFWYCLAFPRESILPFDCGFGICFHTFGDTINLSLF